MAKKTRHGSKQAFFDLREISSSHNKAMSALNTQLMDALRKSEDEGFSEALQQSESSLPEKSVYTSGAELASQHVAERAQDSKPHIPPQLLAQYEEALSRLHVSEDAMAGIERFQLTLASLLAKMPQSQLVDDLSSCFEDAQYDLMPSALNAALRADEFAASDIAFLKLSDLGNGIGSEIAYPWGMKTSLNGITKATALDLSGESSIRYRREDNRFYHGETSVTPKAMNAITAGRATIVDDKNKELFTNEELFDFVSYLSKTPMVGLHHNVGKRVRDWLEQLFNSGSNTVGFHKKEYYHCRARLRTAAPYTWADMRKAPHGIPGTGRFNPAGSAHFYFTDTQKGAESEIIKYLKKGEVLQTARIAPRSDIAMLDLSHTIYRGRSFLRMIRCPLSDASKVSKFPTEYLLPCFVADCCKSIGFEGIKYYGSKAHTNYVSWDDYYFMFVGMC